MVTELDPACHESIDSPDAAPLAVARRVRTGCRGRPRVEIGPGEMPCLFDIWF